jgi:Na+/melibiose symporter-like transporter
MTQALAVGISLPLLGWFGFDPRVDNDPEAINALRGAIALLPPALYVTAILTIFKYPVSEQRLDRLRAAFDRRDKRHLDQTGLVTESNAL